MPIEVIITFVRVDKLGEPRAREPAHLFQQVLLLVLGAHPRNHGGIRPPFPHRSRRVRRALDTWRLRVKQTARTSGSCTVQTPGRVAHAGAAVNQDEVVGPRMLSRTASKNGPPLCSR